MGKNYAELLITRKKPVWANWVQGVLIVLVLSNFLLTCFGNPFTLFLALIFAVIFYYVIGKTNLEYEYIYISGEVRVDKIMYRWKRKPVITMPVEKMEIVAPTGSERLKEYEKKDLKQLDFTSKTDVPNYTVIYNGKEIQYRILMELNTEILNLLYNVSPRKIFKEDKR